MLLNKSTYDLIKFLDKNRILIGRNEYLIRNATIGDIDFLAECILEAEKSGSEILSLSKLLDLSELKIRNFIIQMLKEEVDGCEYSISSYMVVEYENELVAACGSWIEAFQGLKPSGFYKSNLFLGTLPKENLLILNGISHKLKDLVISREKSTLQIEYLYVKPQHRRRFLEYLLIEFNIKKHVKLASELYKIQAQIFSNNINSKKLIERLGFEIVKVYVTEDHVDGLLPSNKKYLFEKLI